MNRLGHSSKEYLGTGEVARILNLSIGTVQGLVKSGKLQAWITEGGHRRIYPSSLDEYLKSINMDIEGIKLNKTKVGILLGPENQNKLKSSNFSPFFEIGYHNFETMFGVISDYKKIRPNLLLVDYYSIQHDVNIELFKILCKHCQFNNFFTIILIPQNFVNEKMLELSQFKNVLLLPDSDNLSWINGYICGLENPISLKSPKFQL